MTTSQPVEDAAIFELEQSGNAEDVGFFVEMAQQLGGPFLDLGCGAGRLAIPLARAGTEVVALDVSLTVLRRFNRRLEDEPQETVGRIRLVQADMRRFALKKRFRGAICSSNTLFLMGSEESVVEALGCVHAHLAPGGIIIIDVASIDANARTALMEYPAGDFPDVSLSEQPGDRLLQRTHSIQPRGLKPAASANELSIRYKYFDGSGNLFAGRREDVVLLSPEELLRMMAQSGYEVIDRFGWYDGRRFSEYERKLILIACKSKRGPEE